MTCFSLGTSCSPRRGEARGCLAFHPGTLIWLGSELPAVVELRAGPPTLGRGQWCARRPSWRGRRSVQASQEPV